MPAHKASRKTIVPIQCRLPQAILRITLLLLMENSFSRTTLEELSYLSGTLINHFPADQG